MFATALVAGKRAGRRRPASLIRAGFALLVIGSPCWFRSPPGRRTAGTSFCRCSSPGVGLGLLVSQLNNYTLSPIEEEHVSEAAGVNSAAGSFGLSSGLAFAGAIMLLTLSWSFTYMAEDSKVLAQRQKEKVAHALEHDAQVISNSQLEEQLKGKPPKVQDEIIRINTDARHDALQIALIVPLLAAAIGFLTAFRMMRLPDPAPSSAAEMALA
jgi:hypothetical protein